MISLLRFSQYHILACCVVRSRKSKKPNDCKDSVKMTTSPNIVNVTAMARCSTIDNVVKCVRCMNLLYWDR